MTVALCDVCGRSEGKIFQDKIQACRHITNVNVMIYFKFKALLKFRNKNYSSIIVNFYTALHKKTY
jgi:hypothetical protein